MSDFALKWSDRAFEAFSFSILRLSFVIGACRYVQAMTNDKRNLENGK
jgi:hypothetical protein